MAASAPTKNGTFCWDWFSEHWGDTFAPALEQHVIFTLIAVGVGFAIALAREQDAI